VEDIEKLVALSPDEFRVIPPIVPLVPVMLNPERLVVAFMLVASMFPLTVKTPLAYVIPPLPSLTLPS